MAIRAGGVTHFETIRPEWTPRVWHGTKRFQARINLQPVYTTNELEASLLQRAELQDFAVVAGTRETTFGECIVWIRRADEEAA